METQAYSRFKDNDLILRDELAIDRTLLANERTLLAYLRAGMTLLIAGVSILHFSSTTWFWAIGLACEPLGIAAMLIGIGRFQRMQKAINIVRRRKEPN